MRRKKEEAEETRSILLKSAYEVFLKKGYESATLMDIVTAAELTRGAAYWHFKNKNEIYEAVINDTIKKLHMKKVKIANDKKLYPDEKLIKIFELLNKNKKDFQFVNKISDIVKQYPEFSSTYNELIESKSRLMEFFEEILKSGCEIDRIRLHGDIKDTADLLFYFFEGLYFSAYYNKKLNRENIKSMINLFIDFNE